MKTTTVVTIGIVLVASAAGAGVWWGRHVNAVQAPAPVAAQPPASAPAAAFAAASTPGIQHPVPMPDSLGEGASHTFADDFAELLNHDALASMLRTDDFDRRFVATVDNLGRSAAPSSAWPVEPVKGRFDVAAAGDGDAVGRSNGQRYLPYIEALERVDLHEAIRIYVWHYASLQHAYEQLGFPGHYFNDRFVQVLDQLLATPEPTVPLRVHLPTTEGTPPTRPWVLYEFDDPDLRSLTAGQQLLLRMGLADERRVKARLAQLRRLLALSPADQEALRQARAQEQGSGSTASEPRKDAR